MLEITPEMLPKAFPVIPEIATAGSIRRRLDESSASVAERFAHLRSNLLPVAPIPSDFGARLDAALKAQTAERVAAIRAAFAGMFDQLGGKLRDALALPTIRPAA